MSGVEADPVTPSERERRIEAVILALQDTRFSSNLSEKAERILNALDGVSQNMSADWWHKEADRYCQLHIEAHKGLVVAEAAARDFAKALRDTAGYGIGAWPHIERALARHPSFSGEEGTATSAGERR